MIADDYNYQPTDLVISYDGSRLFALYLNMDVSTCTERERERERELRAGELCLPT